MSDRFEIAVSPAQVEVLVASLGMALAGGGFMPDSYDPSQDARAVLRDMLSNLVPDAVNDFTA